MYRIYRTDNQVITEFNEMAAGSWIDLINPTADEAQLIAEKLDIDIDDVTAAIDQEEKTRIDLQDGYTLIVVDVPSVEVRNEQRAYTTIPLGIILAQDVIMTICSEDTPVLQIFRDNKAKEFSTKKRLRFVYQILYETSLSYQRDLRYIEKKRTEIEERIADIEDEADLINLHQLESTLVYFATSLQGNGNVLNRLTRYKRLRQYPEDIELLDDVIIENQQALEMTNIYRDIIDGTRELLSTIMDNRLNTVMKHLTSITLILAIPTMISGMYGMNVDGKYMPLARTAHGFGIIGIIILVMCVILYFILRKMKML